MSASFFRPSPGMLFLVLLLSCWATIAQSVYYVSSAATGANNGADWGNAYRALPAALQRGAVYYVAAGNYPPHVFADATSGTNLIIIEKATATKHGAEAGWQAAFGTGQATFAAPLSFTRGYYIFDGQYRANMTSGYGFKVDGQTSPLPSGGDINIGTRNPDAATEVTIRFVEVSGSHDRANPQQSRDDGIEALWGSHGWCVQYCAIHDTGLCSLFCRGCRNAVLEYSWLDRNHSTPAWHAEGVSASEQQNNFTIRYNVFQDIEGTAHIATPSGGHWTGTNWYIYGNVFLYDPTNQPAGPTTTGDGVFAVFDCNLLGDCFFCNNTIVHCPQGQVGIVPGNPVNMDRFYIKNNLWINSGDGRSLGISVHGGNPEGKPISVTDFQWDHNEYVNCWSPADGTAGAVIAHLAGPYGSPLVEMTNLNFNLSAHTAPGVPMPAPLNTDPNGELRGSDGLWDRGAYQYKRFTRTSRSSVGSGSNSAVLKADPQAMEKDPGICPKTGQQG